MNNFNTASASQPSLILATAEGSTIHLFRETEQSLDPTNDQFDFSLWAKAVKKQMVNSLERRNKSKVGTRR